MYGYNLFYLNPVFCSQNTVNISAIKTHTVGMPKYLIYLIIGNFMQLRYFTVSYKYVIVCSLTSKAKVG